MTATTVAAPTSATPERVFEVASGLVTNVRRVVRGHDAAVELIVATLFAGGHVLIEDVPGTGKTTLARALAASIGGDFRRVQGTADLLPSDITGSNVWDQSRAAFSFVPGPIFTNVLLVDEINRTPPRTQSAFLEVMEEQAVTVDRTSHPVPRPFFLVATQNPIDQYGTYRLPESQLDRFAVCVNLGHLSDSEEFTVVREQLVRPTVEALSPVVAATELLSCQEQVRQTYVADAVLSYAVGLVRATRQIPSLSTGASPRAAITLVRVAQGLAALHGFGFVSPADVKAVAVSVLGHRVVTQSLETSAETVIADLVQRTPVPLLS